MVKIEKIITSYIIVVSKASLRLICLQCRSANWVLKIRVMIPLCVDLRPRSEPARQ